MVDWPWATARCVQQLWHPERPFRTFVKKKKKSVLFSVFGLHNSLQRINTHVPSSVQHAAQSLFFFSPCSRSFVFTGWMTKSSLTGRSFSLSFVRVWLWVCVEPIEPGRLFTKEPGHTGASSVRQAATVCSGCRGASHAVRLSAGAELLMKVRVSVGAAVGSLLGAHQLPEDPLTSNGEKDFVLPKDCWCLNWKLELEKFRFHQWERDIFPTTFAWRLCCV